MEYGELSIRQLNGRRYTDEEIIIIDDFRADSMRWAINTTRPLSQRAAPARYRNKFILYRLAITNCSRTNRKLVFHDTEDVTQLEKTRI